MVEVNGIYKSFKSKKSKKIEVLKDISFEAKPGEIYGLLGPNGAGKTTSLRCIATLLKPDKGSISVNGYDTLKKSNKVRSIIGLLTSDMKLSGNLSPRELMQFFGELNHLDDSYIKTQIEKLSEYLGMNDFLDKPVQKLSTGMKQKASIAVSILHDPDVIIFDEPTNGLDILASKIVVDFLFDFKKKGKTIILSTHIMSEAEKLCDKIGIIMNGSLVENGTFDDILSKYDEERLEEVFYKLAVERGLLKNV
ncbi:ABC transporter ATP-binding protein [Oceanotoga sp. DSM 15011]|jgi:sodium transport system ATP-binding protein|uniref:Sodium transport system ATP-binding protein n=1 Tax=Oceanotoga teriensis TaxID=515440 RepID=A0AA45HIR8_9BACT|nr:MULTISPECIES: ABC transporter ATP-binding protein [Oceanotoga]MDN5342196.1 sodium transport system ATP-binding protein [Oceanotoga sp.]PWJ93211.1 sodium transport system ATP-binding protein [Oceanotoga teriensis]UYP01205.1 ABC transporter ATP-binding protein [Oceanotoga sp. DSM 15011]